MSWDVIVMKFPEGFDGGWENLPDDFEPETIGTHGYLKKELKNRFPTLTTENPSLMTLIEETYSIELNVGKDDPIQTITLNVRGSDEALQAIKQICETVHGQAVDTEGNKIDFSEPSNKGFSQWRAFRDQVIKKITIDQIGTDSIG